MGHGEKHVVEWLKKLNGAKCWGYEGITLCEKKSFEKWNIEGEWIKWNDYGFENDMENEYNLFENEMKVKMRVKWGGMLDFGFQK